MKTLAGILEDYGILSPYMQYKDKVTLNCIFHSDSVPSMSVNFIYNNFRCFSCGAEGYAFDLIYELERKSNPDSSIMQLTVKTNRILKGVEAASEMQREEYTRYAKERKDKLHSYDEVNNVYMFYKSLERIDWTEDASEYWAYLANRGFDSDTMNNFHIRVNATSTNPLVIPLIEQASFKGYVARRIDKEKKRKYKNNNGLDKENILVGDLREESIIIVTEGILDNMMSYQNYYGNVGCILGCMPSEVQLEKIAKYGEYILWATDNDKAGEKGYSVASRYYAKHHPDKKLLRFQFPEGVNDLGEIQGAAWMAESVKRTLELI